MITIIQLVLVVILIGITASELIFKLHYLTIPRAVLNIIILCIGIILMKSVVFTVIAVVIGLILIISTNILVKERKDKKIKDMKVKEEEIKKEERLK